MLPEDVKSTITAAYKALLARPGFRSRLGQRLMIAEIARALTATENRIVVAEAPTGTGKSLAYLVTALPIARATGKKVILSTSTVALQEQIANKDLPAFLISSCLEAEYVIAKGRGRYLCPVKLSAKTGFSGRQTDLFGMPVDALQPERVHQAMHDALDSGVWDGDRDSFALPLSDADWVPLTMDRRGCLNSACRFFGQCPFYSARARIERADVVIANHDLLLSDLALGGGAILPAPSDSIVVIDEAHSLPHRAMNHFGGRFSLGSLQNHLSDLTHLIRQVEALGPSVKAKKKRRDVISDTSSEARSLGRAVADLSAALDRGFKTSEAEIETVDGRRQARFRRGIVPSGIAGLAETASSAAQSLVRLLERVCDELKQSIADGRSTHATAESLSGQIGGTAGAIEAAQKVLASFAETPNDGILTARWVESSSGRLGQDHTLEYCPTDVSGVLRGALWNQAYGVVVTSATLTAMGRFEHFRRRAGLPYEPEAVYQKLPSPFDHSRATLVVPKHASADPSDYAAHTAYITLALPDIIEEEAGTLVLFSSRRQMRDVRDSLPDEIRQIILCQDDMPRNMLLAEHADRILEGAPSVIFGLASFAEGIDLPGNLCRTVVIAKLPFDPPGSPADATIAEAITARGGNVFRELILPQAALRLIQAVGRLLRTEEDYGKVYILDSRIRTKGYGKELLTQLPAQLGSLT